MKPTDLRGILQYIPRFREKTFVIAADGAVVSHINFANLLLDIAVLRSLNIRVVLIHGAAEQISQLAEEQSLTPSNLDGTGVTDDVTLKLALTAANGLTHEILEGFATNDLRAANANPRGPEAHQLQRELLGLVAVSGRDVPWGKGERSTVPSLLHAVEHVATARPA